MENMHEYLNEITVLLRRKYGGQEWILNKEPQVTMLGNILFYFYIWENKVQREESNSSKVIQPVSGRNQKCYSKAEDVREEQDSSKGPHNQVNWVGY